tara:strand:- start:47 stop:973 length:927 start_codon:yes stop_codon:yes gene_type:complete
MKNQKLMFDITDTSTSEPLLQDGVFSQAILAEGTMNHFSQILNAKDKVKLGIHQFGNVMQSDSCNLGDQGAGTLSEKEVSVNSLAVRFSVCQRTLEQSFLSGRMTPGSNQDNFLPSDFEAYLRTSLADKISEDLERIVFKGDTTAGTYPESLCDGLEKLLGLDADVITVVGTTVDETNVIEELSKVYDAIPNRILNQKDLVIFCSSAIIRGYRKALANAANEAFYNHKDLALNFLNVKLIEAYGMSDDRMIATSKSNLFMVTDVISDFDEIQLIPQFGITGQHQIILSGSFKFATDFAIGSDIIFYTL